MLVLTRKNQESIVMGGSDSLDPPIKITVLGIAGGKVKLGFEVDPAISVYRSEIWERMRADGEVDGRPTNGKVRARLD